MIFTNKKDEAQMLQKKLESIGTKADILTSNLEVA